MKKKLLIFLIAIITYSNNFYASNNFPSPNKFLNYEEESPKKINYYFYNKRKNANKVDESKSLRADNRLWRNMKNNVSLAEEKSKSGSSSFLSTNGSYEKIEKN